MGRAWIKEMKKMKAKNNYGQRDKNVVNIILKTIVFIIIG